VLLMLINDVIVSRSVIDNDVINFVVLCRSIISINVISSTAVPYKT